MATARPPVLWPTDGKTATAQAGGLVVWHDPGQAPPPVPEPLEGLLAGFKAAYEQRRPSALRAVVSASYRGAYGGAHSRRGLVAYFTHHMAQAPLGVRIELIVHLFGAPKIDAGRLEAVMELSARLKIFGIKLKKRIDSGQLYCEARADGPDGGWGFTYIDGRLPDDRPEGAP